MMFIFYFDGEVWLDIPGYEGLYQASSYGRVRSLDRVLLRKDGRPCTYRGHIMRQAPTTTCRYLVTDLCIDGKRTHYLTHILVARTFYGVYDSSLEVNHIDGNVYNNHISNLELVTHADNIRHSIETGLKRDYGEQHVHAKLTNEQARQVRLRVANGKKQKDVAADLGVSKQLINSIVLYKTYFK